MNKTQELAEKIILAKINAEEAITKLTKEWHGQEPEIIEDGEKDGEIRPRKTGL